MGQAVGGANRRRPQRPFGLVANPIAGGEPERLTMINEIGMYGAFSPNGRIFAFSSTTGIYQMNPDGTELSKLLEIPAADSLSWVP